MIISREAPTIAVIGPRRRCGGRGTVRPLPLPLLELRWCATEAIYLSHNEGSPSHSLGDSTRAVSTHHSVARGREQCEGSAGRPHARTPPELPSRGSRRRLLTPCLYYPGTSDSCGASLFLGRGRVGSTDVVHCLPLGAARR
jgi:hypothetical protein